MIEGIILQLSTEELTKIVRERMEYHQRKSDWALQKMKEIEPELDNLDDEAESIGKYTNSRESPVNALRTQAKHHKDRATYFRFLEAHLVPNETYRLSEDDLRRLEVLSRGF